jgi:hypothetical protein
MVICVVVLAFSPQLIVHSSEPAVAENVVEVFDEAEAGTEAEFVASSGADATDTDDGADATDTDDGSHTGDDQDHEEDSE